MATFGYTIAARVHVAVHSAVSPSDEEWQAYLRDIGQALDQIDAVFGITVGGGPSAAQRSQSVAFWREKTKNPRIAVVTPSMLVVRMAGALRWFMPTQIKSFGIRNLDGAFGYLELAPGRRKAVMAAVTELERAMGLDLFGRGSATRVG